MLAVESALAPAVSPYDAACARIDAWRKGRALGVRRVSYSRWVKLGAPAEVQAFATESLGFVAKGIGNTLEAATVALAAKIGGAL